MQRGRALQAGDTIGIIGLSAPTEQARVERGVAFIEQQGFKARVALQPWAEYGTGRFLFSSDSAERRAQAWGELLSDPTVAAVISVRGAYGSMELLPLLESTALGDLLAAHPKPLIGYSDTTALHLALHLRGVVSIHGPSAESLGRAHDDPAARTGADALFSMLTGRVRDPFAGQSLKLLSPARGPGSGTGECSGELIGGNLSVLTALVGTRWMPALTGKILFLEEVGEKPYRIHRMLLQLKLAGALKQLAGVVCGYFTQCEHEGKRPPTLEQVLLDIFKDSPYPVLCGACAGHELPNLPVPFGIRAKIDGNKLEIEGSAVLL